LSVPISTAPKGERVAGTAQFRNFKGLGWWRVWGSKIARESYLQKAEPGFNFLNDSSGEGCPGALISKEVRALVILEAVAEFGAGFAFQGFECNRLVSPMHSLTSQRFPPRPFACRATQLLLECLP
jgi:hypothetical protein